MDEALSSIVRWFESRFGRAISPLLIGLVLLCLAALYTRPAMSVAYHGVEYAHMAEDPTSAPFQRVGFRILTPLISWALGLRGDLIIITNDLFAFGLIALVFAYFRKRYNQEPGFALIAAGTVTFSMVTLASIYYGGYTDSLTYLIIFLIWQYRKREAVYYPLLLLGLLNHEAILFLIPWFAYLKYTERPARRFWIVETILLHAAVFSAYFAWREYLSIQADGSFTLAYYLKPLTSDPLFWFKHAYPLQGFGLYSVFKGMWVIPVLAIVSFWRKREFNQVRSIALLMLLVSSQLLVAVDTSRVFSMGFLIMIVALIRLFETNEFYFRSWAGWLIVGNLLIPQVYTAAQRVQIMRTSLTSIILHWLSSGT